MARRLVERGVRFVQIFMDGPALGHAHQQRRGHPVVLRADRPARSPACSPTSSGAGLLDETLVVWGGEFGRTPVSQGKDGRDHHPYGFSVWLAGGGIKGGQAYGATDDFGYHAVDEPHQRRRPARHDPPPARPRPPAS